MQGLDYVASHPNAGITYRKSDIILAAHADAGYLNEMDARIRVGAIFFLVENDEVPLINGAVHLITKIIKHVMSSMAEAEIGALFYTTQDGVVLRNTLIEMGWPRPKTPVQTDNSTTAGVVNKTIQPKRTKSMDMKFLWLRCRTAQGQFRFYWSPCTTNLGDYFTTHPPTVHQEKRGAYVSETVFNNNKQECNSALQEAMNALQGCVDLKLPELVPVH